MRPAGTIRQPVQPTEVSAVQAAAVSVDGDHFVGGRRNTASGVRTAGWAIAVRQASTATVLTVLAGILCVVGLVMVGSASPIISLTLYGSPWSILIREALWMGVAWIVFVLTRRVDYQMWRRLRIVLLGVTFLLLLAVLVPGIGVVSGGSSRWIGVGELRVQPSELMKLALAIFCADLLARRTEQRSSARAKIVPIILVGGLAAGLILLQPDMGTAVVLVLMTLALLFAAGVAMRPVMTVLFGLSGLALLVGLIDPYRRERILSFLHPGANQSGSGFQVWQSLIGLGSGHITGLGLGNSREKWNLLPNAHTDFIFSVIGEELGLLGALLVLVLFGLLAWFGLRAAVRAPDLFSGLLALAIVVWITSEALVNVGAVIGILPVTGIPLPFISYGGSSLVLVMMATGVLVNIAQHERAPQHGRERLAPSRNATLATAAVTNTRRGRGERVAVMTRTSAATR